MDLDRRSAFCQQIDVYEKSGRAIVYIDESGFSHDMPRLYGYAPKGQRCYGTHDWGAKGRTNVIGALLGRTLLTITLFNCTINTEVYTSWIEQDLIPKLPPQCVVVMDNATFHKGNVMQESIKHAGHTLLYLPPYSPDLNPIEKKWAQAKALRRRIGGEIKELFENNDL